MRERQSHVPNSIDNTMPKFRRLPQSPAPRLLGINIEGKEFQVPEGDTVAAALLAAGLSHTRSHPVSGAPRSPLCMMGVCFECLVEIDGLAHQQACQVQVVEGMRIRRGQGPLE